jgi:hypothetical protein
MTEAEWLACADPTPMLEFLRGRASERKLRLFAVACCYRIWHLLTDKTGRQAVAAAERIAEMESARVNLVDFVDRVWYAGFQYIDGFRKERDLNIASHAVYAAYNSLPDVYPPDAFSGLSSLRPNVMMVPHEVAWAVAHCRRRGDEDEANESVFQAELKEQVPFLHDLFGPLPFRPVTINTQWMTWNEATVARQVQGIYDERAFDRLPILADALEDAGCTDHDILNHCRGPGPHVRGCWVVDLLTGRE